MEGGQRNPKDVGDEQWWTVRCQVCGAGLNNSTRLKLGGVDPTTMMLNCLAQLLRGDEPARQVVRALAAGCGVCGLLDGHDGGAGWRTGAEAHDEALVNVRRGRLAGAVVPSRAREGALYPTRADMRRIFGEGRGLAMLLMRGRAGYLGECGKGVWVRVKAENIEDVEAGVVYVGMDAQGQGYKYYDAMSVK